MKPVPPNALVCEPARQSECLSKIRLAAMKGRVEAGDLRNLRRNVQDRANGGEIVRLMKRRQRRKPRKVVQDTRCHPYGANIAHTTVNNTVTERGNSLSSQQFGAHGEDLAHGGVMVNAFGHEGAFLDDFALGIGDLQAWRDANPANLTAEKADLFPHRVIERELDAGRPRVNHRDGLRHGHLVVRESLYFCRPGGDNDDLVSTRRGRGSGNEVGAAVDIDCSAGDPPGEGRREIGAGISDVHNVDELPERCLLSRFSEQQLEVL